MPDLGVTPAEARVMWSRQAMTPDQLQGSGFLTEFVLILRRVRQEFVEAFNCYPRRPRKPVARDLRTDAVCEHEE